MLENKKVEAQKELDELFDKDLLPFELSARRLESTGEKECEVRFHDSRLRSVKVSWLKGQRFRDVFRIAVLEKVKRLSGPLFGKGSKR